MWIQLSCNMTVTYLYVDPKHFKFRKVKTMKCQCVCISQSKIIIAMALIFERWSWTLNRTGGMTWFCCFVDVAMMEKFLFICTVKKMYRIFLHINQQVSSWLDLQLPMQSVPITTKIVSSNPTYVITFVSDLRQVGGFLRFPPPLKLTFTI